MGRTPVLMQVCLAYGEGPRYDMSHRLEEEGRDKKASGVEKGVEKEKEGCKEERKN